MLIVLTESFSAQQLNVFSPSSQESLLPKKPDYKGFCFCKSGSTVSLPFSLSVLRSDRPLLINAVMHLHMDGKCIFSITSQIKSDAIFHPQEKEDRYSQLPGRRNLKNRFYLRTDASVGGYLGSIHLYVVTLHS